MRTIHHTTHKIMDGNRSCYWVDTMILRECRLRVWWVQLEHRTWIGIRLSDWHEWSTRLQSSGWTRSWSAEGFSRSERMRLQEEVENLGHRVLFYPFHCELNFIERQSTGVERNGLPGKTVRIAFRRSCHSLIHPWVLQISATCNWCLFRKDKIWNRRVKADCI